MTGNWKELHDGIDWTKTLCHEIGHSVGLDHGEGGDHGSPVDCMRSGSVSTWTVTYNDHHVWHANARKVY